MHFFLFLSALIFISQSSLACEWKPNKVDYKMTVELHEESRQIEGKEFVTIENHSCEAFSTLYFHLYPNAFRWEMDSTYATEAMKSEDPENHFLKYGQGAWIETKKIKIKDGAELSSEVHKELLSLHLPEALAPNQKIVLEIPFVTQMAPIAERSGVWDGNYAISQWFPKLMVYDKKGWALQHNSGYHFIGEFYGDFGSYDVNIITSKKMVLGATGHKIEEHILDDKLRKNTHYYADNVHDFTWVADRKFIERTVALGKTKIHVLTRHPETQVIGEFAQKAMQYYGSRLGEYPYEDFTVAETYYNGPMEFPQMIFVRSWPAKLARWLERDASRLLELAVTHESSHQWFCEVVGNNEVVDAWMDEAFATYLEVSFMNDHYKGADQNILKFTSLLQLSDNQMSEMIWRLEEPEIYQPIQTPSYLFGDPDLYYASTYYKAWLFFRQLEGLIGRDKFNHLLRDYYQTNKFKNASPEDWYAAVTKNVGSDAARWFKNWNNTVARSDYAISSVDSSQLPDGRFSNKFQVSQLGNHFVPVDVELTDETGQKYRERVNIQDKTPVDVRITTRTQIINAEVDPDHIAPDVNRFNNTPGFFPKFKVWPFTTKTIPSDAVVLFALPSVAKSPGLGYETGIYTAMTHYLDWFGEATVARDWRHKKWDVDSDFQTLEPNSKWGVVFNYERDVLINQASLMTKRGFGPEVGHDPSASLQLGGVFYGDLGDDRISAGAGGSYTYSNMDNGKRFRYSATLNNAVARDFHNDSNFDRFSTELHTNITLEHWVKLDIRDFYGQTFGQSGLSALFDLQAGKEGGMRFDSVNLEQYKFKKINSANFELQLPVPYGTFVDSLAIIHGPSWEWHLFSDVSTTSSNKSYLVDAGIGTRFYLFNETFGSLGFNVELVPYQNVTASKGFAAPAFIFNMISTK